MPGTSSDLLSNIDKMAALSIFNTYK